MQIAHFVLPGVWFSAFLPAVCVLPLVFDQNVPGTTHFHGVSFLQKLLFHGIRLPVFLQIHPAFPLTDADIYAEFVLRADELKYHSHRSGYRNSDTQLDS
ncbi:hypothetical protein D3C86_1564700 [compost metagenome]